MQSIDNQVISLYNKKKAPDRVLKKFILGKSGFKTRPYLFILIINKFQIIKCKFQSEID